MKKKVLVVNQKEDIILILKTLLESRGYNVIVAKDGYECEKKISKCKPDLVLLPIIMRGPSAKKISERFKDTKIIYITRVRLTKEQRVELKEKKGNPIDIINYPFDPEKLIATIKGYIS